MVLQYYEEADAVKAGFGNDLTFDTVHDHSDITQSTGKEYVIIIARCSLIIQLVHT